MAVGEGIGQLVVPVDTVEREPGDAALASARTGRFESRVIVSGVGMGRPKARAGEMEKG